MCAMHRCPECESASISELGEHLECNDCGHGWRKDPSWFEWP